MKLFLRRSMVGVMAAAILCCGCMYNGAGGMERLESGIGIEQGNGENADRVGKSAATPWQYADIAMGTVVQQTVYAKDETAAGDFSGQAMELLLLLEREKISWRMDTSEVYRANGAAGSGEGFLLSEDLAALLKSCLELWERSEGAFDVTLGAVTRLWNIDKWAAEETVEGFRPPAEEALAQALDTCGSQKMLLVQEMPAAEVSAAEDGTPAESQASALEPPEKSVGTGSGKSAESRALVSEPPERKNGTGSGKPAESQASASEPPEKSAGTGSGKSAESRASVSEPPGKSDGNESGTSAESHPAGKVRLFLPEGTQLDLGAVGKGFAMEKLGSLLAEHPDVTGAVISLGGSILTYGSKPDNSPWRVGIVNPFDTSASIGILTLEGQWCISTSGDYERYVDLDGVRYHHILDPKTGSPAVSDVRGVTILMKDGLLSDGLSTACYILGPEKGMALAEQYGAEVLFVMADGYIEMSDGMERYFKRL